jgi:alpha-ribazole phosphatase
VPPQIALIRHMPPLIPPGLCYGRLDVAAMPAGVEALALLRGRLHGLRNPLLLTSPAKRCRVLAGAFGKAVADARLLELDFGAWEGQPWDSIPREALDRWAAAPWDFTPPGGEAVRALHDRVRAVADELRRGGRDAVVVSHGGPLRLLPALLRGKVPDLLAPSPGFGAAVLVTALP